MDCLKQTLVLMKSPNLVMELTFVIQTNLSFDEKSKFSFGEQRIRLERKNMQQHVGISIIGFVAHIGVNFYLIFWGLCPIFESVGIKGNFFFS